MERPGGLYLNQELDLGIASHGVPLTCDSWDEMQWVVHITAYAMLLSEMSPESNPEGETVIH